MLLVWLHWTFAVIQCVSASAIQNSSPFNLTTTAPAGPTSPESAFNASSTYFLSIETESRKFKPHLESAQTGFDDVHPSPTVPRKVHDITSSAVVSDVPWTTTIRSTETESPKLKPHLESTQDGFEAGLPVATEHQNIGITTTTQGVVNAPRITETDTEFFKSHPESSRGGFQDGASSTVNQNIYTNAPSVALPQNNGPWVLGSGSTGDRTEDIGSIIESVFATAITTAVPMPVPTMNDENTAGGWQTKGSQDLSVLAPLGSPPTNTGTDTSGLEVAVTQQGHGTIKLLGTGPARITPPPTITQVGIIIRPVPSTGFKTTTDASGNVYTLQVVTYNLVASSSTLAIGSPITVSNMVIALTTDASGSTILIAGDMTTTLPALTQNVQAVQQVNGSASISVATTIIQGTTAYIIADQTLAPGHPITVSGVTVSITTSGSSTILVMDNFTTTLAGPVATSSAREQSASTAVTPGSLTTAGNTSPTITNLTAGVGNVKSGSDLTVVIFGVLLLVMNLG